ncbi:hypothetical protein H0H87_012449 [Tephrocybe sp. NHM501043]|nr:hypothetical protein H0H87_012449 [Tephrocybe sp. NHM501043]
MSAYDIRPGGSLKLKGGVAEGGIVKKKKKKSKSKSASEKDQDREKVKKLLFREDEESRSLSGSGSNSPTPSSGSSRKTEAEKRFEEVQKRRLAERVAKLASKTHKDRVSEFNNHLESLSEHHDIPKLKATYVHPPTQRILLGVGKRCLSTRLSANSPTSEARLMASNLLWSAPFRAFDLACPLIICRECVMSSLEEALLSREPNEILSQVLQHFILNLKPQTRNLSTDQVATTVASVLADYFKTSERTIFWNDELKRNVDPFENLEEGFFTANWDFKLKILRQLVELQLSHNADMKATIDRAWGVSQNKHKKKDATTAPPEPSDPKSQAQLQLLPIGQDSKRTRYWVGDDSPRVFTSTNPWKITATFHAASTTREEYLALIESLKETKPRELKKGERRSRTEAAHIQLIATLEGRIEAIDEEIAEDADEYAYQEEDAQDEEFDEDDFLNFRDAPNGSHKRRAAVPMGERRRSTRTTATRLNDNGKRESSADSWSHWRGERRSSRLAPDANVDSNPTPPAKRARTEESTMSTNSAEAASTSTGGAPHNGLRLKKSGAAALKSSEIAVEQIPGKKKSKFWVYAVEPIPDTTQPEPVVDEMSDGVTTAGTNGHGNHNDNGSHQNASPSQPENGAKIGLDRSLEGSLSPLNS